MSFCFHIIYTPGTVKPLQLFLHSLLKWSDCTFRLVDNGCRPDEGRMLQAFCNADARLSYLALPTKKLMVHSEALNYLQAQNQDDYFCFMDSDIYAIAPFMPDFVPVMDKYSGIFSGMPLRFPQSGLPLPQGKAFWAGPYTHTATGICAGSTFFAIYNNRVVTEIRRTTGIDFTKYRWEAIPPAYQAQIEALGLRHEIYDTAKVLNLVLHLHGYALHQQPCPPLRHIEAVSRFEVIQSSSTWRKWRTRIRHWRRKLMGQPVELTYDPSLPHLARVLQALAHGRRVPELPKTSTESDLWVAQTHRELLALHAEFAQRRRSR